MDLYQLIVVGYFLILVLLFSIACLLWGMSQGQKRLSYQLESLLRAPEAPEEASPVEASAQEVLDQVNILPVRTPSREDLDQIKIR